MTIAGEFDSLGWGQQHIFCMRSDGHILGFEGHNYSLIGALKQPQAIRLLKEWHWLIPQETLFLDTKIWILCSFPIPQSIFLLIFLNHLKIYKAFLVQCSCKNAVSRFDPQVVWRRCCHGQYSQSAQLGESLPCMRLLLHPWSQMALPPLAHHHPNAQGSGKEYLRDFLQNPGSYRCPM